MAFELGIRPSSAHPAPLAAAGPALAGLCSFTCLRALRTRITPMPIGQAPAALVNTLPIPTAATSLVQGRALARGEAIADGSILVVRGAALPGRLRNRSLRNRWWCCS